MVKKLSYANLFRHRLGDGHLLHPRRPTSSPRWLDPRQTARVHPRPRRDGQRPRRLPRSRSRDVDLQRLCAQAAQDGKGLRPGVGRRAGRRHGRAARRSVRGGDERPDRRRLVQGRSRRPAPRPQRQAADVPPRQSRQHGQPQLLVARPAQPGGQRRPRVRRRTRPLRDDAEARRAGPRPHGGGG